MVGSVFEFGITIMLLMLARQGSSAMSFNFRNFNETTPIKLENNAYLHESTLRLARDHYDPSLTWKYGQAWYENPIQLWDPRSGQLTDFDTHFVFSMKRPENEPDGADGMTFFLAPFDSSAAKGSNIDHLGLFPIADGNYSSSEYRFVAVEFDTFMNSFDPSPHHVGIDINSIISNATADLTNGIMNDGREANAWVTYDSASQNLSVFLTYDADPVFDEKYRVLSHRVDMREYLQERVKVGFTAATAADAPYAQTNNVYSWSFNSSLDLIDPKEESNVWLIVGLALGLGACGCGVVLLLLIYRRRSASRREEEEDYDESIDGEFGETGPKRFTYSELSHATNGFSEQGKLGQGGFGGVYKGVLSDSNTEVAVKRISKGSSQGKKEYVSEVKVISRLRHRNLVQLLGWCHTKGEFILVYEFLPNGSLDTHLFGTKPTLTWTVRHKIAHGLASSILYLHEEWEQCVVHRDIKSSNVMLDSNFTAKLGDFGLARFADHESGMQTTMLAGTMGYMAPECVTTGRASKESDVYSFGVVALEICCGRKPVERNAEPSKVSLVEWVWDLYGQGRVLEGADTRLSLEFDEEQMESLMVVGLWCCHPDPSFRPSIKQVMSVLNFEAPLPSLPSELPRPMYFARPLDVNSSIYASSTTSGSYFTDSSKPDSQSMPLHKFSQNEM